MLYTTCMFCCNVLIYANIILYLLPFFVSFNNDLFIFFLWCGEGRKVNHVFIIKLGKCVILNIVHISNVWKNVHWNALSAVLLNFLINLTKNCMQCKWSSDKTFVFFSLSSIYFLMGCILDFPPVVLLFRKRVFSSEN